MRPHELSDAQLALVSELMPPTGCLGGRWRSHCDVVNRLFWKLDTGVPWRDIPARYGPWQTICDRFVRWRRNGLFDRLLERPHLRRDGQGQIDWDVWCVDGTNIRATQAAAGGRKGGMPMSRTIMPSAARAAALAPRSIW
ncbi:putative transposase of IS4/5 family DUF4096 [Azospirillum baldaniorum]|uniref:transposase n=1 Tax=Azospirillum baldaniorum TaxID=1064539 RepID=UPI0011A9D4DB|nr:transposase [Azospirillum baldaniorum]TWA55987.1 putative transposase of IS4/5 family DUF4096 [Azospirillum baldaniorum]